MAIGIDILFVCAFYLEPTLECWTTFTLMDREPSCLLVVYTMAWTKTSSG
jgi:hypothetical protein